LFFEGGNYHVLWNKHELENGGVMLTGSKIHNMREYPDMKAWHHIMGGCTLDKVTFLV